MVVLEAGRVVTEKVRDYCPRTGIEVTAEMTLSPRKPARIRRKAQ